MRGSGKFCSSFWSPIKFISVTFIFPWWPVYGKWQRIRLHSCLEQPQTRLCAGSHAGFLLFLGCAGGGILLTLREEYLFSSIPMESFSICSAAHQRSSFLFSNGSMLAVNSVKDICSVSLLLSRQSSGFHDWTTGWACPSCSCFSPVWRAWLVGKNAVTGAAQEISHCKALCFGCGHTSVEPHCETKQ